MRKDEFIELLKKRLSSFEENEVLDVIDYYTQLIDEKVELGEDEKEFINSLNIDEIVNKIKVDLNIKKTKDNPTMSNSLKALYVVLAVFAAPIALPVLIVILSIILVIIVCFSAIYITLFSVILSMIVAIFAVISACVAKAILLSTTLFAIGIMLMTIGIFIILINLLNKFSKLTINCIIQLIRKTSKKKEA